MSSWTKAPEERPILHAVPDMTTEPVGVKWCRTMTEAKAFAKDQAKREGQAGYTVMSLPFSAVAAVLGDMTWEALLECANGEDHE